jgi:alpha-L-fucosidase 2
MLAQSHDGIELLPALPHEWPEGSVSGLRLRGGFELDLEWEAHALRRARLRATRAGRCRIRTAAPLAVQRDGRPVSTTRSDGFLAFDAEAGAHYDLAPA